MILADLGPAVVAEPAHVCHSSLTVAEPSPTVTDVIDVR